MSVVLATDGKPHSSKAVDFALEYARLRNEELFLVFVVTSKDEENREASLNEARRHLDDVKRRATEQGVEATSLLESGNPAEGAITVAERVKASAIVVGTSGKTVLDRVLIGSVSEYIVRNAPCTVIVVR